MVIAAEDFTPIGGMVFLPKVTVSSFSFITYSFFIYSYFKYDDKHKHIFCHIKYFVVFWSYNVKLRSWYISCKANGAPSWLGLSNTIPNTVTDRFCYPLYQGSTLVANTAVDIVTSDLNLLQGIVSTDVTTYIYEIFPNSLILAAASNGELLATGTTPKKVDKANSPIIRDSYNHIRSFNALPSIWTSEPYLGSDGDTYQLQYRVWDDRGLSGSSTITHRFACVVVKKITNLQTDAVTGLLGLIANVNVSLTHFMQVAIDVSSAVAFQTGLSPTAPLESPLIEESPLRQGISQQALWATMKAYTTNAQTSRAFSILLGDESDKILVMYEKYSGSYRYYYGASSLQTGYSVYANGTINTPNGYTANYDPTGDTLYRRSKNNFGNSWSNFYTIPGLQTYGVISFGIPYYSLDESTLKGVVATTRCLKSSTSGEDSFASVLQTFQVDTRASVVYIMTTTYRLVATSFGEDTWMIPEKNLKRANESSNTYVAQTASYLSQVWSNTTNQYSVSFTDAGGSLTFVYCTTLPWVDGTGTLQLNIVAVSQPISITPTLTPTASPVASSTSSDEYSEIAADASVAAAIFSAFIFFGGVAYAVMNYNKATLPMAGPKSSRSDNL